MADKAVKLDGLLSPTTLASGWPIKVLFVCY